MKVFASVVQHCDFVYMKYHAEYVAPMRGSVWKIGAATFFNEGGNGRWRNIQTADEAKAYVARAEFELGPDCADWLESGTGKFIF